LLQRLVVVGSLAENVGEGGDSSGREFGEEGLRDGLGGSRGDCDQQRSIRCVIRVENRISHMCSMFDVPCVVMREDFFVLEDFREFWKGV
jgi:hypothetical protein